MRTLSAFFATTLLLAAAPVATTVSSVNGSTVTVPATGLKAGVAAIVTHRFSNGRSVVTAQCTVTGGSTLECLPSRLLYQEALPFVTAPLAAGDQVIVGLLSHRTLIIAPSQERYRQVQQSHPDREWVHPDLLAARMMVEDRLVPTPELFASFCENYYVGSILFALEKEDQLVDCLSFKELARFPSPAAPTAEPMTPFYHRLGSLEGEGLNLLGEDRVEDYEDHYSNILGGTAR